MEACVGGIRARGLDIKKVWNRSWYPQPSKVTLAEALWPALMTKIDDTPWSEVAPIPAVAELVHEAYLLAQRSRIGTIVIRAASAVSAEDTSPA